MILFKDLVEVGIIKSTQGNQGELKLSFFYGVQIPNWAAVKALFLGIETNPVPFFIKTIDTDHFPEKVYVTLEEIKNQTEAYSFKETKVYLPSDQIHLTNYEKEDDKHQWIGYRIINLENKIDATVEELLDMPTHEVIQFTLNGKEVLLPVTEETLTEVDDEKQILRVTIPDGLLEIYLEN